MWEGRPLGDTRRHVWLFALAFLVVFLLVLAVGAESAAPRWTPIP